MLKTLDAPEREFCTIRRSRTNTPLQALLLMNETQYMEAANRLAQRALRDDIVQNVPETDRQKARIAWLYETVASRPPTITEQTEIQVLLSDLIGYYSNHPSLTAKFENSPSPIEAAWTIVASTILNLDEVVSK